MEPDTVRLTHAQSPEDHVSLGRDVEKAVQARAVHAAIQKHVFMSGHRTVVFPGRPGSCACDRRG